MPGQSTPQTQQVQTTTSNIPDYAKPYFTDLLTRAQGTLNQPYQPYPYERIAGFNPAQEQVQQNTLGLSAPNQFAYGSGLAAAAGQGGLNTQTFGNDQAQQYMSPYISNVLDVQRREAIRNAQQGQLAQNLAAARQGTYGGSRQLIAATERERNLGQQLGDIQAKGLQAAYENAQKQFGADRAAQQAGFQLAGQAGQTLGNLGQLQQQTDLSRLQAQSAAAAQPQALEQQRLDQMYQDFVRQRDYPVEQLGAFSNILHGLNVQPASTQTTYAAPPSLASQLVGGGLGALSLSKLLSGAG